MKRQLAAPQNPPVLTCVITLVALDDKALFELPCCKNPVATDAIVEWFKKSDTNTCPCCRDEKKARSRLIAAGHDLTPVAIAPLVDRLSDRQIYDGVMQHISRSWRQSTRCKQYLEFGLGLIEKKQFELAQRLIETLSEQMNAAQRKQRPMFATIIIELGDQFKLVSGQVNNASSVIGMD